MLKYFLRDSGNKANFYATLLWVVALVGGEICLLIGGMIAGVMTSWTALFIALGVSGAVLIGSFVYATQVQCLAEAAGGITGSRAVEHAGSKMQIWSLVMLIVGLIFVAATPIAGLWMAIVMKDFWLFGYALLSMIPGLLTVWSYALLWRCLGDLGAGEANLRRFMLAKLLENAGSKTQVMASVEMMFALIGSLLMAVAGILASSIADNTGLLTYMLVGAAVLLISGWVVSLRLQAAGNVTCGVEDVWAKLLKPILGNAGRKLQLIARGLMALTLAATACLLVICATDVVEVAGDLIRDLRIADAQESSKINVFLDGMMDILKTAAVWLVAALAAFVTGWGSAVSLQALSEAEMKDR